MTHRKTANLEIPLEQEWLRLNSQNSMDMCEPGHNFWVIVPAYNNLFGVHDIRFNTEKLIKPGAGT